MSFLAGSLVAAGGFRDPLKDAVISTDRIAFLMNSIERRV